MLLDVVLGIFLLSIKVAVIKGGVSCFGLCLQVSKDRIGYFYNRRPEVVLEASDKPFDFKWPQPDGLRAGGPLLQLRHASYTYPGAQAPVLHVSYLTQWVNHPSAVWYCHTAGLEMITEQRISVNLNLVQPDGPESC